MVHCLDSYHLLHPAEPTSRPPEHANVHVHGLKSGVGWLSPLLTQQSGRPWLKMRRLRALLAERPYDVLHCHTG